MPLLVFSSYLIQPSRRARCIRCPASTLVLLQARLHILSSFLKDWGRSFFVIFIAIPFASIGTFFVPSLIKCGVFEFGCKKNKKIYNTLKSMVRSRVTCATRSIPKLKRTSFVSVLSSAAAAGSLKSEVSEMQNMLTDESLLG